MPFIFEKPVALIFFNRPASTLLVLEQILRINPKTLILVSDGPRASRQGEAEVVETLRAEVELKCRQVQDLIKIYAQTNLGCAVRVSSAITEILTRFPEAIFLEDDCLPGERFFSFTAAMLDRYRDDQSVMSISGTFLKRRQEMSTAYGFSSFPLIWGWATWSRAWSGYCLDPAGIQPSDFQYLLAGGLTDRKGLAEWVRLLAFATANPAYTWDYQWQLQVIKARGRCIHPYQNLVTNIGFGADATHTKNEYGKFQRIPVVEREMDLALEPLRIDVGYNRFLQKEFFHDRWTIRNLPFRVKMRFLKLRKIICWG
jgi:hypothetical protein